MKKIITAALLATLCLFGSCDSNEPISGPNINDNTFEVDSELFLLMERISDEASEENINCIDFNYSFVLFIFDENHEYKETVRITGDQKFSDVLGALDDDFSISIQYPITGTLNNGDPIEINTNEELKVAIDFFDENHGFAVGFEGVIEYTEDGGVTWTSQSSGTTDALRSVIMRSPTKALIVVDSGTFLRNFSTLNIEEHNTIDINILPNPVKDELFISTSEEIKSVLVYDLLGRLVYNDFDTNSRNLSIDFSNYQKGRYLVQVFTKNEAVVKKL